MANPFEITAATNTVALDNKREGDSVEVKIPSGARTFEVIRFTTMHGE